MKAKGLVLVGALFPLFAASALVVDRGLMAKRIEAAGNSDDVHLFYRFLPEDTAVPESYDDLPLQVLLPAFMLSELKTALLVGFQVFVFLAPFAFLVLPFWGIRRWLQSARRRSLAATPLGGQN